MFVSHDESIEKMLQPGTVLWRQASFGRSGVRVDQFEFVKTEKGSFMAKMGLNGNFLWEPEVHGHTINGFVSHGITLFLREEPPEDWTHLILTGVGEALKKPTKEVVKGGCVFAMPVKPLPMPDYLYFRERMGEAVKGSLNALGEARVALAMGYWPDEEIGEHFRLVCQMLRDDKVNKYFFEHIQLE